MSKTGGSFGGRRRRPVVPARASTALVVYVPPAPPAVVVRVDAEIVGPAKEMVDGLRRTTYGKWRQR